MSRRVHPLLGSRVGSDAYGPLVGTGRTPSSPLLESLPHLDEVVLHPSLRRLFMRSSRTQRRARIAAVVSAALAVTGFQLLIAPQAQAVSANLVINEAYVNGGSASATYKDKFVELYNPTGSSVTFTGSVQYRSA